MRGGVELGGEVVTEQKTRVLRDWQAAGRRAFKDAMTKGKRNLLTVVTPGAGKGVAMHAGRLADSRGEF